ncbi:MAG: hypothetical protein ACK4Z9_04070 [Thermodesulfovibrionales bacterium]
MKLLNIFILMMRKILLCSHDPMLIKNLYGLFIDGGFVVDVVDQSSFAIKKVMEGDIDLLVMDAATFGLSVTETIEIIKNVVPDLPYIIVGSANRNGLSSSIEGVDLERLEIFLRAMKEPDILLYKGVKDEA